MHSLNLCYLDLEANEALHTYTKSGCIQFILIVRWKGFRPSSHQIEKSTVNHKEHDWITANKSNVLQFEGHRDAATLLVHIP